jgi:hypothetical protein
VHLSDINEQPNSGTNDEFIIALSSVLNELRNKGIYTAPPRVLLSFEDAVQLIPIYTPGFDLPHLHEGWAILRISTQLPSLITVDTFIERIVDLVKSLDIVYSIFALLTAPKVRIIDRFLSHIRLDKDNEPIHLDVSQMRYFLTEGGIPPLGLISTNYGSPASFDFLGIGKVLEVMRDTIKDVLWRAKHEKEIATLEKQGKQIEIEKIKLEAEKTMVEIIAQKLDVIEKAQKLDLSEEAKSLIILSIIPQIETTTRLLNVPLPLSNDPSLGLDDSAS